MRRLSEAEERLLAELAEPNRNADNCWYFPRKNLRTLQSLTKLGLAEHVESDHFNARHGYRITKLGRTVHGGS